MILQPIVDIAEICAKKGVTDVVASPGSRCAPITLAFTRHQKIKTRSVSDERSAAFIAMGMAQQGKNMVVLVCTSGSAAYNYAPGVAEAYYQQVPLLILTADRPPEWIDQYDGQTIQQPGIFGKHVKQSFNLPVDYIHPDAVWQINRTINEAVNLAESFPQGPVHVNVPIREPFYENDNESFEYSEDIRVISQHINDNNLRSPLLQKFKHQLKTLTKVLIVAGQVAMDEQLIEAINEFAGKYNSPVIADIISNCQACQQAIKHQDAFLGALNPALQKGLTPQLLITFGKSVISKQLKIFLRKNRSLKHWHIQENGAVADTFQSLTDIIHASPATFFRQLAEGDDCNNDKDYFEAWKNLDNNFEAHRSSLFASDQLTEFTGIMAVLEHLPKDSILHLSNSMSVRYANFIGLLTTAVEVFANRGTSGIDGSVSTALGVALKTGKMVILITGDMAFFYDRNAFWHSNLPANLRVVVMNNHAGGIFGLIKGPDRLPELATWFETDQPLNANHLADEYNFKYQKVIATDHLSAALADFLEEDSRPKILEIETDKSENKRFYQTFKKNIKKIYGN